MEFKTEKADWYFVISAALVWIAGLIITAWDFIYLQKASYRLNLRKLVGATLILIGVPLRQIAKRDLGRHYTYGLTILEDHRLVRTGAYERIRHPGYLGTILTDVGMPLLFSSLRGFAITLLLVPLFLYRIRIEEKMLVERFGKDYIEYKKMTKRLIPFVY